MGRRSACDHRSNFLVYIANSQSRATSGFYRRSLEYVSRKVRNGLNPVWVGDRSGVFTFGASLCLENALNPQKIAARLDIELLSLGWVPGRRRSS